jgi:geranylgeranyl diphosphate synthase, type II
LSVETYRERANAALNSWLSTSYPGALGDAMRYALLGGGKRIRPILVYSSGTAVGASLEALDHPACAVELIHAYSLIHDDLPAMDDDDLRRGRPTCHKVFGEALAILAGDALQALAFEVLTSDVAKRDCPPGRLAQMVRVLAQAAGAAGMVGGQAIDLEAVGRPLSLDQLEDMHLRKTGALIQASVRLGALSAPEVQEETLARLDAYAKCIGLAFQIRDDILDVEGDTATLGKTRGADASRNKPTYPSLLGLGGARELARALHEQALAQLDALGAAADRLRWLAQHIVERVS